MTDEVFYNIAAIRELLAAAFDDVSLDAFCNDHFFGVYDRFGRGMRKDEKITLLLDHVRRRQELARLLTIVQEREPEVYARFEANLREPARPSMPKAAPVVALTRDELGPDRMVWKQDGKEMVRVPDGVFLYGDDKTEMYTPEFWIDRTPVTNAEYARFVAATGHKPPQHWQGQTPPQEIANHPVVYVSWHDAVAYAGWAGKRLPTEEEWEKAARGTDGRAYPWGDWQAGRCNTREASIGGTTPVGRYSPGGDSPYGCADMAGNVWEWTGSSKRVLWVFEERVLRGGTWRHDQDFARCAFRDGLNPRCSDDFFGFRCVSPSLS